MEQSDPTNANAKNDTNAANIAVIGAGWWSQGWHLPSLHNNQRCNLVAIVDTSPHPKSNLNPDLEPMTVLAQKYQTRIYSSTTELLMDSKVCSSLDGVVIATPHATHYKTFELILTEHDLRRSNGDFKPLHVLMEKPMSTDVHHALFLHRIVTISAFNVSKSQFWVNHSANHRSQTKLARDCIQSGRLGRIRHVTAYFASPLSWIFDDPELVGWNKPEGDMLGNGFAWGQSSHLFAFLYRILDVQPLDVHCRMTHSEITGADVSFSATVRCNDDMIMSVSGTSLLGGNAHSDPPVPKEVRIDVFGTEGSLHYGGNDREPTSGKLEYKDKDGTVEVLNDKFHFENLENEDDGPESLREFVRLCDGDEGDGLEAGANVTDGLRSIQTIDAMYRSHASSNVETVLQA